MNEIKNRVIKTELTDWKSLKELQPKGFKELSKVNYERLKQSIIKNDFVMSFTVWDSGKEIFIIDGHHRYKVLKLLQEDNYNVPDKLPCTFIECKNKKEASKLVLTYSSIYAKVQDEGLYEFLNLNEFNFEELRNEIDIPEIDFERFELGYLKDSAAESYNKLSDLFLIPPFSIFDTSQGYWQERQRQWIGLGIKSEIGRGENIMGFSEQVSLLNGRGLVNRKSTKHKAQSYKSQNSLNKLMKQK